MSLTQSRFYSGLAAIVLAGLLLAGPAVAAKGGKGGGGGGGGPSGQSYTVGGSVSGLESGDTITLQNNGGDDLLNLGNGTFTFATPLSNKANYEVTVASMSDGVSCSVSNGAGRINKSSVDNVLVTCQSEPPPVYTVGGDVSGLSGGSLVLLNNGGDDLTVTGDGAFTFNTPLEDGAAYSVTIEQQPAGQTCTVSGQSGSVSGTDVTSVMVTCVTVTTGISRLEGAGDSIMRGYNASCTGNTGLLDVFCYSGGDQEQNSYLDGWNSSVLSLVDRYQASNANFNGGKAASESGSEMIDPTKNNFAAQADAIVAAANQPVTVVVELGGNDLCNRTSDADLYTDAQWTAAVDAGLQTLVDGLPDGSTVYLASVPRVQDLRSVGIAKQNADSGVNCESFWSSWDVCRVATANDNYFAALEERQKAYNDILVARAEFFNGQALNTGVEVVAEYQGIGVESVGTYAFQPSDINGGDCFHPSISGQNKLSEVLWQNNPFK